VGGAEKDATGSLSRMETSNPKSIFPTWTREQCQRRGMFTHVHLKSTILSKARRIFLGSTKSSKMSKSTTILHQMLLLFAFKSRPHPVHLSNIPLFQTSKLCKVIRHIILIPEGKLPQQYETELKIRDRARALAQVWMAVLNTGNESQLLIEGEEQ
jgi:hypothetical protein